MFKPLNKHSKPVRYIHYCSYILSFILVSIGLIVNEILFTLAAQFPLLIIGWGELFYQSWYVKVKKKKNTKVNVLYLLFFSLSVFIFPYPPQLKKVWTKIGEIYQK
jgi:hypothetical protein